MTKKVSHIWDSTLNDWVVEDRIEENSDDKNQIIASLETIQNYCKSNKICHKCPYAGTICGFRKLLPEDWRLKALKYKLLHGGDGDGEI